MTRGAVFRAWAPLLGGAIGLPVRALAGLDQLKKPAAPASVIEGSMEIMSWFHIREVDVNLCERSRDLKTPITVIGRTDAGLFKPFKGVVESIEHDTAASAANKWCVTMRP